MFKYSISISKYLLVCIILMFGCANKEINSDKVFNRISHGLKMSNKNLETENISVYMELKNKLNDPVTRDRALIWESKSVIVKEESQKIREFLDSIIKSEQNENISRNLSNRLFLKLHSYYNKVVAVDNELTQILKREKSNLDNYLLSPDSESEFYNLYFENNTKNAIVAAMYSLINNTNLLENVALSYFNDKSCVIIERFDTFSAIVGQSSNTVEKGDEIEITAGIGAFSKLAAPIIYIDGKNINLNENAVANYKFRANGDLGMHSIPVKISYTNPNGLKQSKSFSISYKIRK